MANSAIGGSWEDFKREYFTPEEIRDAKRHTAVIGALIDAREEHVISPEQYTELCIRIDAALDTLVEAELDVEMATEQAVQEHKVLPRAERGKSEQDTVIPLVAVGV